MRHQQLLDALRGAQADLAASYEAMAEAQAAVPDGDGQSNA